MVYNSLCRVLWTAFTEWHKVSRNGNACLCGEACRPLLRHLPADVSCLTGELSNQALHASGYEDAGEMAPCCTTQKPVHMGISSACMQARSTSLARLSFHELYAQSSGTFRDSLCLSAHAALRACPFLLFYPVTRVLCSKWQDAWLMGMRRLVLKAQRILTTMKMPT